MSDRETVMMIWAGSPPRAGGLQYNAHMHACPPFLPIRPKTQSSFTSLAHRPSSAYHAPHPSLRPRHPHSVRPSRTLTHAPTFSYAHPTHATAITAARRPARLCLRRLHPWLNNLVLALRDTSCPLIFGSPRRAHDLSPCLLPDPLTEPRPGRSLMAQTDRWTSLHTPLHCMALLAAFFPSDMTDCLRHHPQHIFRTTSSEPHRPRHIIRDITNTSLT